jgi:pimeloyl-ACP methyl ester carboxylesterase
VRVASTDDVTLELHHFGGEGPPMLVVHATGFCAAPYRHLLPVLGVAFELWALDVRSHGDATDAADGEVSWQGTSRDVLAAVDAIGGGPVAGFGHSMGGASLLGAELQRPGTLTALYAYEPIVFPHEWLQHPGPNPLATAARRRRPGFASRSEALHRYASRPPLGRFRADVLHDYVDGGFRELPDGTVTLSCAPEQEARTFDAPDKITIEELGAVAVPVRVARGARELAAPPAQVAGLAAAALAHGELVTFDHLSHFGPFEDPDTVAEDALAFLTRVTGDR